MPPRGSPSAASNPAETSTRSGWKALATGITTCNSVCFIWTSIKSFRQPVLYLDFNHVYSSYMFYHAEWGAPWHTRGGCLG